MRARPDLVPSAVEEGLRYGAPIQGFFRTAVRPFAVRRGRDPRARPCPAAVRRRQPRSAALRTAGPVRSRSEPDRSRRLRFGHPQLPRSRARSPGDRGRAGAADQPRWHASSSPATWSTPRTRRCAASRSSRSASSRHDHGVLDRSCRPADADALGRRPRADLRARPRLRRLGRHMATRAAPPRRGRPPGGRGRPPGPRPRRPARCSPARGRPARRRRHRCRRAVRRGCAGDRRGELAGRHHRPAARGAPSRPRRRRRSHRPRRVRPSTLVRRPRPGTPPGRDRAPSPARRRRLPLAPVASTVAAVAVRTMALGRPWRAPRRLGVGT